MHKLLEQVAQYQFSISKGWQTSHRHHERAMGILTDFFVASDDDLAVAFCGWMIVANTPSEREVKNPFTGELQRTKEWQPLRPIGSGVTTGVPDIRRFPHVLWKRVEYTKLALLDELLTGRAFLECLDAFLKPALLHPSDKDVGLVALPVHFVAELGILSDQAIRPLAVKWQQAEELQNDQFSVDDCVDVLQALRDLALKTGPQHRLYWMWCL